MDFNFFDPYINVETKPDRNKMIGLILLLIIVIAIGGYQAFLMFQMSGLEKDLDVLTTFIESPETQSKFKIVQAKQAKESQLQQAILDLQALSLIISLSDKVNLNLVDAINNQVPSAVFLSELTVNNEMISIKGYSTDYEALAQFARNLRQVEGVGSVLIPTVTENEGNYGFSMIAQFFMEVQNENKQ